MAQLRIFLSWFMSPLRAVELLFCIADVKSWKGVRQSGAVVASGSVHREQWDRNVRRLNHSTALSTNAVDVAVGDVPGGKMSGQLSQHV